MWSFFITNNKKQIHTHTLHIKHKYIYDEIFYLSYTTQEFSQQSSFDCTVMEGFRTKHDILYLHKNQQWGVLTNNKIT